MNIAGVSSIFGKATLGGRTRETIIERTTNTAGRRICEKNPFRLRFACKNLFFNRAVYCCSQSFGPEDL